MITPQQSKEKFCVNCGTRVQFIAIYCPNCGAFITTASNIHINWPLKSSNLMDVIPIDDEVIYSGLFNIRVFHRVPKFAPGKYTTLSMNYESHVIMSSLGFAFVKIVPRSDSDTTMIYLSLLGISKWDNEIFEVPYGSKIKFRFRLKHESNFESKEEFNKQVLEFKPFILPHILLQKSIKLSELQEKGPPLTQNNYFRKQYRRSIWQLKEQIRTHEKDLSKASINLEEYNRKHESGEEEYFKFFRRGLEFTAKRLDDLALDCFNKAIELGPNKTIILLHKAYILYKLEKYDLLIDCANQILQILPSNNIALELKGLALYNSQNYNEALQSFSELLSVDKKNFLALRFSALIYYSQQNWKETLSYLKKCYLYPIPNEIQTLIDECKQNIKRYKNQN